MLELALAGPRARSYDREAFEGVHQSPFATPPGSATALRPDIDEGRSLDRCAPLNDH